MWGVRGGSYGGELGAGWGLWGGAREVGKYGTSRGVPAGGDLLGRALC